MQLSREIRFALVESSHASAKNSWAGWPSTNLVVPHLTLSCLVEGEVQQPTGYICNIKHLDDLMRGVVTTQVIPNYEPGKTAELLISEIFNGCLAAWKSEVKIIKQTLFLSPYLSFSISANEPNMIELTQQFEFSASHRLNCDHLSEEENKDIFGKCNNPEGHGHNYVVEVSVKGESPHGQVFELHRFEAIVKELVIDVLDHKHLNRDVPYFSTINPSVENITRAIWDWLNGKFDEAVLSRIRVYETPKTWAQYSG